MQTQNQEKHQIESYKACIKDLEEWMQTSQKEKPPYVISSADNDTLKHISSQVESSVGRRKKNWRPGLCVLY